MVTTDVTIAKGAYSLSISCHTITEDYKNNVKIIAYPTTTQNQSGGYQSPKAIDLLLITHEMILEGFITPNDSQSADQVKSDLITIFSGAGTTGSPCTVTYNSNLKGPFSMYITGLNIKERAIDESTSLYTDSIKYSVIITLSEGVKI
jgi:hypothetical protein